MATIKDIYQYIDSFAPFETQMDFDNAGFLVGWEQANVETVLVALDITLPVIREAVDMGAQLIVAHHPVIFNPIKRVSDASVTGEKILLMAENRIGAICAHTNLDAAQGGVNDCLAHALELGNVVLLEQDGVDQMGRPYGIGRVGDANTQEMGAAEYAAFVKDKLNAASVRFVDTGKPVRKVAVGGGSCGSMLMEAVQAGCDTFVTSDVKYNIFLDAKEIGLNLMDAGHYATENVVCLAMERFLKEAFPELTVHISQQHCEVYQEA